MPKQKLYCAAILRKIGYHYRENIYVNITIPICLVGMILNLLNLLVFTRKTMNSPPNLILAHLAFVDFLYLLTINMAKFWENFIVPRSYRKQSYASILLHEYSDLSISTLQFISAFLTVQLAAWRYIAVVHPLKERHWCSKKITRYVLITGYVLCCVIYAIPRHLSCDIDASNIKGKTNYIVTFERHPIMNSIRYIVHGMVVKLLPSVLLVGLTSRIVVTLLVRKTRRKQLTSSASTRSGMQNVEMRHQTNRSTAILLAVAALYFIAEFPRGILSLLRTINKNNCYKYLVKIFQTIININASITFVVYYTLSQQFRTTFNSLFRRRRKPHTSISHQTAVPLALGDTDETDPEWKISEV